MSSKPSATAAEVAVKLVLDSNAKTEAAHIKDGLKQVDASAGKTAANWKGKLGSALGTGAKLAAAGLGMTAAAAAAAGMAFVGLGEHAAHAYMESEEQVRGLAATLTLIDQKGTSFDKLVDFADDLKNGLEDVAMAAGVTDDAMVAVFNDIIERGGKGTDEAFKLAEAMAYAGRSIPGGAEALSSGFEAIQMGMVRAKNPVVQLIASTQTLKGSAKSVAKEMQKMSIEDQMALAEKAIEKMSGKMKDAPMTIGQMATSMKVGIGNLFEEAGKPIVGSLGPAVAKIRELFTSNQAPLQKAARLFGEQLSRGIDLVVPVIDGIANAVRANWGDIQKILDGLYASSKDTFDYLWKNKEAIGKTIGDAAAMLMKAGAFVANQLTVTKNAFVAVLKAGTKAGLFGSDAKQFLKDETRTSASEKLRGDVNASPGVGVISNDRKNDLSKAFVKQMTEAGEDAYVAEQQFNEAYARANADHTGVMMQVAKYREAATFADSDSFIKAWQIANKSQDEGAKEYVANFLATNRELVKQIGEKGPEILGAGFGDLVSKLEGMHSRTADDLRAARPKLGIEGKQQIVQNFNGGIQIKQDFRDQDPDRIVTTMREDLARAGSTRIQSPYSAPFGF